MCFNLLPVFVILILLFNSIGCGFGNPGLACTLKEEAKRQLCLNEFTSLFINEEHLKSSLTNASIKTCCLYAQLKDCLHRSLYKSCLTHESTAYMLSMFETNLSNKCSSYVYTVIHFSLVKFKLVKW